MATLTVSKSAFASHMQDYFKKVEKKRDIVIVTSRNKPVLTIQPVAAGNSIDAVFNEHRGQLRCDMEDLLTPETEEWQELG
jgi:antitoxin (DNA-binding transcriptional repressor) of toxin-antitoxin stability system